MIDWECKFPAGLLAATVSRKQSGRRNELRVPGRIKAAEDAGFLEGVRSPPNPGCALPNVWSNKG